MRRERYILIIAIILLVFVILAANLFFDFKISLNKSVASVLGAFAPNDEFQRQILLLQQENANLKAQLFKEAIVPQDSAIVYSSYPFNNKSEIVISWGTNEGVAVGDVVAYGNNIIVGQVREVTAKNSVVTTIFDPNFEVGDRVVTASPEFPYGLELGQIKVIDTKGGSVFKSATLEASFEIKALRNVSI